MIPAAITAAALTIQGAAAAGRALADAVHVARVLGGLRARRAVRAAAWHGPGGPGCEARLVCRSASGCACPIEGRT